MLFSVLLVVCLVVSCVGGVDLGHPGPGPDEEGEGEAGTHCQDSITCTSSTQCMSTRVE